MPEEELTIKQERFCREYVLCMNASEAYRRAYNAEKMLDRTIWKRASELLAKRALKGRIDRLKTDVEEMLGINKVKMIETLQEVVQRSLQKVPVMKWDHIAKVDKQVIDDKTGEGMWEYDSAGANSAIDKIMKAMGYYEAEKIKHTIEGSVIIAVE